MSALDFDASLVSDAYWGRGYGDHPYTEADFIDAARYVAETQQSGYGPRLFTSTAGYEERETDFVLPPGYDATGHPNRVVRHPATVDGDFLTSLEHPFRVPAPLQDFFRSRDWKLDQHGRPCNPLGPQLAARADVGLNTGIGLSYFWGEQTVVDVVVKDGRDRLLYTTRQSDGRTIPSLIGGYSIPADYGLWANEWAAGHRPVTVDGIFTTAVRKVQEEAGLRLPAATPLKIIRAIRPTSSPHTWNYWTCTFTVQARVGHLDARSLDPACNGHIAPPGQREEMLDALWPDHLAGFNAALF